MAGQRVATPTRLNRVLLTCSRCHRGCTKAADIRHERKLPAHVPLPCLVTQRTSSFRSWRRSRPPGPCRMQSCSGCQKSVPSGHITSIPLPGPCFEQRSSVFTDLRARSSAVEHLTFNQVVVGSIPTGLTILKEKDKQEARLGAKQPEKNDGSAPGKQARGSSQYPLGSRQRPTDAIYPGHDGIRRMRAADRVVQGKRREPRLRGVPLPKPH